MSEEGQERANRRSRKGTPKRKVSRLWVSRCKRLGRAMTDTSQASLSSRFKSLHATQSDDANGALDVSMYGELTVNWGRRYKGYTFEKLYNESPQYVQWFLDHCRDRGGRQEKFLEYIQYRIELDEEFGAPSSSPDNATGESSNLKASAPVNSSSAGGERMDALEARVGNVEGLLREILQNIQAAACQERQLMVA